MSVYIEGMEMPKDGRYTVCITHDSSGNVHWVFQNEDTHEFLKHGRVKELPTHGRLIDADALEQDAQSRLQICNKYDNQFQKPYEVMRAIALAPTVIPASREEEDS